MTTFTQFNSSKRQIYTDFVQLTPEEVRGILERLSRYHGVTERDWYIVELLKTLHFLTAVQIWYLCRQEQAFKTILRRLGILVNHHHLLQRCSVVPQDGWPSDGIVYALGACSRVLLGEQIEAALSFEQTQSDEIFQQIVMSELFVNLINIYGQQVGAGGMSWVKLEPSTTWGETAEQPAVLAVIHKNTEANAFFVEWDKGQDWDQKLSVYSQIWQQDYASLYPVLSGSSTQPGLVILTSPARSSQLTELLKQHHLPMGCVVVDWKELVHQSAPFLKDLNWLIRPCLPESSLTVTSRSGIAHEYVQTSTQHLTTAAKALLTRVKGKY